MRTMILLLGFFALTIFGTRADATGGHANDLHHGVNVLPASALHPFGRWMLTGAGEVEMIGSAVHFGFQFSGTGCAVYVQLPAGGGHNYLQYELDGVYQGSIRIEGGSRQPLVIKTGSAGVHTVWIYKMTEAMSGAIFIEKIAGQGLLALKRPEAPVIEFIGNSITCGALADKSMMACGIGDYSDHHNGYYAYGPRVARALKVNYLLSSVSGIGIYRTWNRDAPSMPQVYEHADLSDTGRRRWDFAQYRPVIVSIALGTNDLSKGDGKTPRAPFDSAKFVGDYVRFVRLVKTKYPAAQIALLSSPMVRGAEREMLQHCLMAVKAAIDAQYPSGRTVATFFFEPMVPRGCGGHPSVEDHALLAAQLEPFFSRLLRE
ncbi:SGNH/GDSL hydrolase family protein [Puia sp.]|uniref:SGNH/GDSL hydrolase family protein n=1 Tax=Puia sp. TaxID=2045100 RepID=UPI002F3F5F86